MKIETLRQVASVPLPSPKKVFKYRNAREANNRIHYLETQLGLTHGDPILNVFRANDRALHLEELFTSKTSSAGPAAVDPTDANGRQAARLACQRDRIAAALPSLKGIDLACGRQKIADLNAKISKLNK